MRISGRTLAAGLATVVTAGLTAGLAGAPPAVAGGAEPPDTAARSWQRAGECATGEVGQEITSIALDPENDLVVAMDSRRVRTYDRVGEQLSTFTTRFRPGNLDVAADGDIHLLPAYEARGTTQTVRVLGPKGRTKRLYGRDQVAKLGGFEIDEGVRRLIISDQVWSKVVTYDVASGRQLRAWGKDGTEGSTDPNALDFPNDLALMPDNQLVLANSSALRVFQRGGRYVRTIGQGRFDISVERVAYGGGRVFGLESRRSEVEVFAADGAHQRTLRTGIRRTVDVAASPNGNVVYVAGRLASGEPGIVRWVRR